MGFTADFRRKPQIVSGALCSSFFFYTNTQTTPSNTKARPTLAVFFLHGSPLSVGEAKGLTDGGAVPSAPATHAERGVQPRAGLLRTALRRGGAGRSS